MSTGGSNDPPLPPDKLNELRSDASWKAVQVTEEKLNNEMLRPLSSCIQESSQRAAQVVGGE